MFKHFLFLAILTVAVGSHDAIAGDVFGFKWKMSYVEASKMASGGMEKLEKFSHFNKSVYVFDNPKEPSGAKNMVLSFFNDELYSVNVAFFIKRDYDFKRKVSGIVGALESKHPDAEMSEQTKGANHHWFFDYRNGAGVIENPYNLEKISVFTTSGGVNILMVFYDFYGAKEIGEHIKKLKDEKEFGGF